MKVAQGKNHEFRDVPGFEGRYQVSRLGVVRSLLTGRELRPGLNSSGYLTVGLYDGSSPKSRKSIAVHDLVASLYIGPKPAGHQVDHIDRNRRNNAAENLRYAIPSQNVSNGIRRKRGGKYFTSRFRGVQRMASGRFQSVVFRLGCRYRLGTFDTEEQAARAYDARALELHGEFAVLNFPITADRRHAYRPYVVDRGQPSDPNGVSLGQPQRSPRRRTVLANTTRTGAGSDSFTARPIVVAGQAVTAGSLSAVIENAAHAATHAEEPEAGGSADRPKNTRSSRARRRF